MRERWLSPLFQAGRYQFSVEADEEFGRHVIDIFRSLQRGDGPSDSPPTFSINRSPEGDGGGWKLAGPNTSAIGMRSLQTVLDSLVAAVNLSALDADPEALHLHAAAACRGGDAAIIVGESGSGKTTLVASLSMAGWSYISDETVRVTRDAIEVSGFAKSLSVRSSTVDLLPAFRSLMGQVGESAGGTIQVSPARLRVEVASMARPRLLLFVSLAAGREGAEPTAKELPPSDAVVRMMTQTMDAERFGSDALKVLARVAAGSSSYEFSVGEPAQMIELVEALMDGAPTPRPLLRFVDARGDVAEGVCTAFIGDLAVIHKLDTGVIFSLDAGGCVIWQHLLDASLREGSVDLHGPVESRFLAQLSALGVVGRGVTMEGS